MNQLTQFGEHVWICEGPRVRMMTIPFTTRMTIVELEPGSLWVHSPIDPTAEIQEAVNALGDVKAIIAPNRIHSLGVEPWKRLYPLAEVWVSPRFQERHPDIPIDHVIGQEPPLAWKGEIDILPFQGSSFLDEVVFFHGRSGTLIITDLIQRHDPFEETRFWRLVKGAVGVLGSAGGTARDLLSTFNDRVSARESAEALLQWDFDRVVISHGMCITKDAHRVVEDAFQWALA